MSPRGESGRGEALGGDRGRLRGRRRSRTWILAQGGILLALAVTTSWLLQRADTLERRGELAQRGRSVARLVAHSLGSGLEDEPSARAHRVLSTAVRGGLVTAGAVLDAEGVILAHTDLKRVGEPAGSPPDPATLFPEARGTLHVEPLDDSAGHSGTVVLLAPQARFPWRGAARAMVPSLLILLAFVVTGRAMIRRTLARANVFMERLAVAMESEDDDDRPAATGNADTAMDHTVARVVALCEAKRELTVRNRILTYKKQRIELILERFPDGLIVADPARTVIFANRATARALGPAAAGLPGRNLRDSAPALRKLLEEADRSGRALVPEELAGAARSLSVGRTLLTDSGNRSLGTLYTVRDVTAQQAAQRAQTEFLSQVTHELKAPLHTIVTYVEELADDEELSRAERQEYSNTLNAEVDRMAQLISNLLQLSRIQLGNLSAQRRFVKPAPLVVDQATSLRATAEDRGLTLQIEVPENLPAVHGDKDLLGVAVTNLVSNAIKYTPSGGRIVVSASAVAGGVSIEVADTGVGIPPNEHTRIFEKFTRSEQESVQRQSGSGLGLSLVKEIVEIHDGQITLDSAENQGTTFRIWLPCREAGTRADVVEALT